jgi:serine acetyltransferase
LLGNPRLYIGNLFWCIVRRFPLRMVLCDLSLSEIPRSTNFIHPIGIVIRDGVKIGNNCTIYQNVTIGTRKSNAEPPSEIGNDVEIFAGAMILGPVKIGDGAVIGAGAIVLTNVPAHSVFVCETNPRILYCDSNNQNSVVSGG